jgi:hypothetical protein
MPLLLYVKKFKRKMSHSDFGEYIVLADKELCVDFFEKKLLAKGLKFV